MKKIVTFLTATSMLFAVQAQAQTRGQSDSYNKRTQSDQQMAKNQMNKKLKNIEAEVISTKRAKFKNSKDEHLLAKVRLQSPNSDRTTETVVDFGPVRRLDQQNARVRQGDRFRAQAGEGKINRQPVLFVYSYDIANARNERQRNARQAAKRGDMRNPELKVIEGEVVAMKDVNVKGISDSQRLIRLRNEDAKREYVVSVGTKKTLNGLDLEVGDTALVKGMAGRINGKRALFATKLAEVATVDRRAENSRADRQRARS